jgi:DNA polymerase-3 subunit gamma/tau
LVENWDVVGAKQVEGPNDILPPAPEVEPVGETEDETATFADAELTVETPISHENSEKVAQENAAVIALEQIEMIWPEVIRDVRVHDKMVQALLNSGVRPVDVEGNIVVLEVASDFFLNKLNQPSTRQTVERVLKKLTNIDYFIRPTVKEQHIENQNVLREQIRTSRKDPLVKAAINIFDAEIVAVESTEE